MKRIAVILSILFLTACSEGTMDAEDSVSGKFEILSRDQLPGGYVLYIIKDKDTGCEYITSTGNGRFISSRLGEDGQSICGKE